MQANRHQEAVTTNQRLRLTLQEIQLHHLGLRY